MGIGRRAGLQVAASLLVELDGLEERLEVAGPEALVVVALDHFEEQSRPVLHRLREDLQQVAVVVVVDEDLEFLRKTGLVTLAPSVSPRVTLPGGRPGPL